MTLSTALGFEPRPFDCRSTALTTELHRRPTSPSPQEDLLISPSLLFQHVNRETKADTQKLSFIRLRFESLNIFPIGSEAKEPSQLIAKKSEGGLLKPETALVSFVYTPAEYTFGGGALLSRTFVIAPFIIFRRHYHSSTITDFHNFAISLCRVAIRLNPFRSHQIHREHYITDIKHNVGPDCDRRNAIALVMIKPKSLGDATLPPSWVQHIPIASQSYTPGLHSVSESVIVWDEVSKP